MTDLTFVELSTETVDAARSGDSDALTAVYKDLAPRVLGYLRARGCEDPEGLTNEVFLAVIPRLANLRGGPAGLRTLVFSVAHARYVDETRRRSVRPAAAPYDPEQDTRTAPSAESLAAEADLSTGVLGLLDRLGEDQRTAVSLRVLGDLSLEQTAQIMGRSTGAVKQLQRRALLTLKALLERREVNP